MCVGETVEFYGLTVLNTIGIQKNLYRIRTFFRAVPEKAVLPEKD
jgi:hypothetical protein